MPLNRFEDEKLKKIFECISGVNKEAYKDIYLLSNQVLNKNPFFLSNYFEKRDVGKIHIHKIFLLLARYYLSSLFHFFKYVLEKLLHYYSFQRYDLNEIKNDLIIIDTFFLVKNIVRDNSFADPYFIGLDKLLNKRGKTYAYLPVFNSNDSICGFRKTINILKKQKTPVLTEYQLLGFLDLAHLLFFTLVYPFHVLKIAFKLDDDSHIFRMLKYELISSLKYSNFEGFSRYLQGKKISSFPCNVKVISWYENQVIHKNLYKGLRENNLKNRIKIYGCQLLLYPFSLLSMNSDPAEIPHNTVPDKVLVNGTYYLYNNELVNSSVGPSFRYRKLFETKIKYKNRKNLLILLPYFTEEISNILKIIADITYTAGEVIVKFHPATNKDRYQDVIPASAHVSNENVYDLFQTTKIVIGIASGSLVEAASLAIPAIVPNSGSKVIHNYLPSYGQHIIWDYAKNGDDINQLIEKYCHTVDYDQDTLLEYAEKYKKMFFTEPSEDRIVEAFDL